MTRFKNCNPFNFKSYSATFFFTRTLRALLDLRDLCSFPDYPEFRDLLTLNALLLLYLASHILIKLFRNILRGLEEVS